MKIAIQPTSFFVPGKGTVTADVLHVRIASYQLGQGASAYYEVQRRTTSPEVPNQVVDEPIGISGNCDLTAEQFAAWGKDDDWFARCIAQNLGLFPITPA